MLLCFISSKCSACVCSGSKPRGGWCQRNAAEVELDTGCRTVRDKNPGNVTDGWACAQERESCSRESELACACREEICSSSKMKDRQCLKLDDRNRRVSRKLLCPTSVVADASACTYQYTSKTPRIQAHRLPRRNSGFSDGNGRDHVPVELVKQTLELIVEHA